MSALEQEIVEKFRLLDKAAQQRVLSQIEQDANAQSSPFTSVEPISAEAWLQWSREFRSKLRAKYGAREVVSSADLLNEAREERLNDLMGGR